MLQDPGLHVVDADGDGGGSGGAARTQLLEQPGEQQQLLADAAGVKGGQQGGGSKRGSNGDAAASAGDEQQQDGAEEAEQDGHPVHTGQAQQAQQEAQQQQPQQRGARSPSKFAQALQRQREAAAQEAGANKKARQPLPTSFPPQPEPPVVELSPEEVARCGWEGQLLPAQMPECC